MMTRCLQFLTKPFTNKAMNQEKQTWMLKLLENTWVSVYLDPRKELVQLPDFLRQEAHVVLQYGYQMPVPIRDFRIDELGISAILSFQQTPYQTFVPWAAVFAITNGEERMQIWPKDLPSDLELLLHPTGIPATSVPASKTEQKLTESSPGKKYRPPHLKLVD